MLPEQGRNQVPGDIGLSVVLATAMPALPAGAWIMVEIIKPALKHLPSYKAALERGWSPDNVRLTEATREQLAAIEEDPAVFLASFDDPGAKGGPITLPDGTKVPRLPGFRRWIWDGEIAGSIGFRWQPGTPALPPHVLGHIGYAVVPWRRRRGYATEALRLMLDEARAVGLPFVEITAKPDNPASHKVILANGGKLVGRFFEDASYGGDESMRYRIDL
jgi:predicted acetyltransferase